MEVFWGVKLPFLLSAYLFLKVQRSSNLSSSGEKSICTWLKKGENLYNFVLKIILWLLKKCKKLREREKNFGFGWMQRLRKFFKALWFFAREKKNLSSKGIFFWLIICMYISSWRRYVYNLHIYSSCLRNSGVLKYSGMGSS